MNTSRSVPRPRFSRGVLCLTVIPLGLLTGCFQTTPATKQLSTEIGRSIQIYGETYDKDLEASAELARVAEQLAVKAAALRAELVAGQDQLFTHNDATTVRALRAEARVQFETEASLLISGFPEAFEQNYLKTLKPDLDRLTAEQRRLDERLTGDRENTALYRDAALATMRLLTLQRQVSEDNRRLTVDLITAIDRARAQFLNEIEKALLAKGLASQGSETKLESARTVFARGTADLTPSPAPALAKPFEDRRVVVAKAFAELRGAWGHVDHVIQTDNERETQLNSFFEGLTGGLVKLATGRLDQAVSLLETELKEASERRPQQAGLFNAFQELLPDLATKAKTILNERSAELAKSMTDEALKRGHELTQTKPTLTR